MGLFDSDDDDDLDEEELDEDDEDSDEEPVTFVYAPRGTADLLIKEPVNKHVKAETPAKHARCSICEMAAQSHPHKLCELTMEQVAASQAEPDAIRKHHLMNQQDRNEQLRGLRRRLR